MEKVLHFIDRISHWSGQIFCYVLVGLVVATIYEVVARYMFNAPTSWSNELTMFLCGGGGMLAGAYAFLHNIHPKVDIVYGKLSEKKRAIIDIFTFFLYILPFVGVLLVIGGGRAWASLLMGEGTDTPWSPPLWPARATIAIGAFLLTLQAIAKFIRDFCTATRKRPRERSNA